MSVVPFNDLLSKRSHSETSRLGALILVKACYGTVPFWVPLVGWFTSSFMAGAARYVSQYRG